MTRPHCGGDESWEPENEQSPDGGLEEVTPGLGTADGQRTQLSECSPGGSGEGGARTARGPGGSGHRSRGPNRRPGGAARRVCASPDPHQLPRPLPRLGLPCPPPEASPQARGLQG